MTEVVLLLVVEDEPAISLMLEDELERAGFGTLIASSGKEAIGIINTRYNEIAGLITDIRLGDGPDGWEVAYRARELNPSIPIAYMSGDSAGDWPIKGVPKSAMLQKPFAGMQIVVAISTLLNEAGPPVTD